MLGLECGAQERTRVYTREIGQFDRLKVIDDVNVVYRCEADSTGLAVFEGEPEFEDAFIFTLKDGQLKVQVNTEDVGHPRLPTLYLYSDFLTFVENTSNFTTHVQTMASCAEFKAVEMGNGTVTVDDVRANKVTAVLNTGNGTINVSGTCHDASFRMIGTGLIQADRLKADRVKCSILGSGSIGCWPLESLSVKGIGSTKIYYKGDPKVKKTGGGKLFPIPEMRETEYTVDDGNATAAAHDEDEDADDDDADDDDTDDEAVSDELDE